MGTRINVLMPHNLADWSDRQAVLHHLSSTLEAAQAIASYWTDDESQPVPDEEWIAEPPFPPPETRDYHRYTGPGPLFVEINPHSVHIRTGGRWRGFLSIQSLRAIHIRAFHAVANAFRAPTIRCFPDDDFTIGAFWEGADFEACCSILDQRFGNAVMLDEAVDPVTAIESDTGFPLLQYVSTVQ